MSNRAIGLLLFVAVVFSLVFMAISLGVDAGNGNPFT